MPDVDRWTFDAIGTSWTIDTAAPLTPDVAALVTRRIDDFDRAWSRFRGDSLVTRMAAGGGTFELPAEAERLLGFYAELDELTDGAVNPLVGGRLADLGYGADYSLVPAVATEAAATDAYASTLTLTRGGPAHVAVETDRPVVLDVGAAGKGLLVDLVAALLADHGFGEVTVDASGDLFHGGPAPLRVALEHPGDPELAIGVVEIEPQTSLCASATNRRAWGDGLHHVIDARTGLPTEDVVATWVVAADCMHADGLATAYFFAGPDRLSGAQPHEFVRVLADGRVEWSPGFPGEVFT